MRTFYRAVCAVLVCTAIGSIAFAEPNRPADHQVRFTADWRFFKGEAQGAEQPGFDDSQWRRLDLPHDWAIEGPFDRKYDPHAGGLPFYGVGWYRKHFDVPASAKGSVVMLQFDGAMSNSTVWINGENVGGRPYGYSSFAVDLTPHIRFGGENVVAVRLAPEDNSSRWYPGAGIYRNVWLITTPPVRVAQWGTYITTPVVTDARATVNVRTEIENRGTNDANVTLDTEVLDASGHSAGRASRQVTIAAGAKQSVDAQVEVAHPHRWDLDDPYLYSVRSRIRAGSRGGDQYVTSFGIRTIEFTKDRGFLLNGKPRKFQGVCDHHDLGALGAAVSRRAIERQLEILKAMGVNAIRTSHNPPAPELLDLADRMGFVVMDEAFDMWKIPKKRNGLSKYWDEWHERDLRDFIRRDRNHPSVVLWSIGNEVPEQGQPDGAKLAQSLTDICHEEDRTRPTTAAFNNWEGAIKNHLTEAVDIPGFNYAPTKYGLIQKDHPDWIIFGSETASAVSSRGVYQLPIEKYEKHPSLQLTSYDVISPPWAYIPDVEFDAQEKNPRVMGEFVWTGFDYLGEPTPYFNGRGNNDADWPARSSYFGIVDLAGFPKDRYYLYQSQWTNRPMVHVLPHWNWTGMEGKPIPVMVYSNADEVELFLNGKSLGRKKRFSEPVELPVGPRVSDTRKFTTKYRLMWQVAYEPGSLKVVGYRDGRAVASDERKTAGAPARIVLNADRSTIASDGDDLSFITVRVEDKDGNLCPLADNLIKFHVEGPATIAGVDNGNAATVEPFQADYRKAFNGMALLIVRGQRGESGSVRIAAGGDGLQPAEAKLAVRMARELTRSDH